MQRPQIGHLAVAVAVITLVAGEAAQVVAAEPFVEEEGGRVGATLTLETSVC
jgi:hypothetical protein